MLSRATRRPRCGAGRAAADSQASGDGQDKAGHCGPVNAMAHATHLLPPLPPPPTLPPAMPATPGYLHLDAQPQVISEIHRAAPELEVRLARSPGPVCDDATAAACWLPRAQQHHRERAWEPCSSASPPWRWPPAFTSSRDGPRPSYPGYSVGRIAGQVLVDADASGSYDRACGRGRIVASQPR